MMTYSELARDLEKITGLEFEVDEDHIISTTPSNYISDFLMSKIGGDSSLLWQHGANGEILVPLDTATDEICSYIKPIVAMEDERIARLEEAKMLLFEKTGIHFKFDKSHRMLVALNPLQHIPLGYETAQGGIVLNGRKRREYSADWIPLSSTEALQKMENIVHLEGARVIECPEFPGGMRANMIGIHEVEIDLLRNITMPVPQASDTIQVGDFQVPAPGRHNGSSGAAISK